MFKSIVCKIIFMVILCLGYIAISAETILNLESKDGVFQDTGTNELKFNYTKGVSSTKIKDVIAMKFPLKSSMFLNNAKSLEYLSMGKDSMTLSAMVKITGSKGEAFIMCNGAGTHLSPGYRFGAEITDSKINFYLFLVGKPFEQKKYNSLRVNTDLDKRPVSGSWMYVTMVINREQDAIIYINGNVVGKGSIAKLAKEELSSNYFSTYVSSKTAEIPCEMSIANIVVERGLVSSVSIKQNAEKWLMLLNEALIE